MSARIRPPTDADQAEWRRLWDGYNAFYQVTVPAEVRQHTWRRIMAADGAIKAFVAEGEGGGLCGLAHYLFHASTWSPTCYCYLEDLFVDPFHRGAGVGQALIEAVYAAADKAGATRIYWSTQEGNATARRLYDKVATLSGFVLYRR